MPRDAGEEALTAAGPLAPLADVKQLAAIKPAARTKTMKALLGELGDGFTSLGWASPRAGGKSGPPGPPIPRVMHTASEIAFNLIPGGTFVPGPTPRQRKLLEARRKKAGAEEREHLDLLLTLPKRQPVRIQPFLLAWVPLSGDDVQAVAPDLGALKGSPAMIRADRASALTIAGFELPTADEHEWAHRATLDGLFAWGDDAPTPPRFEAASGEGFLPAATNAFALMGIGAWPELVLDASGALAVRGGMAPLFPFQGLGEDLLGVTFGPTRREREGAARLVMRLGARASKKAATAPEAATTERFTSLKLALRAGAAVGELSLRETKVGKIPKEIGGLVNLRVLDLCATNVTALPAELGKLASLEELDLTANDIASVPAAVGELPKLRSLIVSTGGRAFHRAYDVLFRIPSLERVSLHASQSMRALPAALRGHPNLRELELWLCRGITELPTDLLASLPKLRALNLSSTGITKLPAKLAGIDGLEALTLDDLPLKTLPRAFCELPLRTLSLRDVNDIVLGDDIARLTRLERLGLGGVHTRLPAAIGRLGALRSLSLSNGACAEAPAFLSKLRSLEELDVSCNELEELPAEVYALPRLRKIICFNSPIGKQAPKLRARYRTITFES